MTKNKSNKKKIRVRPINAPRPQRKRKGAGGESPQSKLLYDPCNAPLAVPAYDGAGSGSLIRLKSQVTIGVGATATAGVWHWSPGAGRITGNNTTSGATAGTLVPGVDPFNANGVLVNGSAGAYRVVAACMRITPLCSEQTRAGRIALGNTTWAQWQDNGTYTPDSVMGVLPYSMRAPADTVEIVWVPNAQSELFRNGASTYTSSAADAGQSALTFAWSGIPANTGFVLEYFLVAEYMAAGLGSLVTPTGPPPKVTLSDVLRQFWSKHKNTIKSVGMSMVTSAMSLL